MLADERVEKWGDEAKRVYIVRQAIEEKVRARVLRSITLTCEANPNVLDAYHVAGGTDPNGHTVTLFSAWGEQCTCYSHMMNHEFCKHLIRAGLERGQFLADTWPEEYRPGLFSRAVQVDLKNAARKAVQAKAASDG
jgi:hypothetical protein